jgi:YebC/PmpR family DNA-binding regulatory protein
MAGHSKWANIQHRKNAQDAKRGKLFTKLIREITVAARTGGGEPGNNPRLRTAIDKALEANMTRDTIDRAIKRGAGGDDGANMEEVRYEGYGPGGVAIIVDCLTDNRNRTVGEVRHAFTKCGGNLGTDGSVAYLFSKKGVFTFAPGSNEDHIMEVALEAGAEDVTTNEDGSIDVLSAPEDFAIVKEKLLAKKLEPVQAEITFLPSTTASLENEEQEEKFTKLIDMLEDIDDVQNVYSNVK